MWRRVVPAVILVLAFCTMPLRAQSPDDRETMLATVGASDTEMTYPLTLRFAPPEAALSFEDRIFLGQLGTALSLLGADRVTLTLLTQTTPGLSPAAEDATELARYAAVLKALQGSGATLPVTYEIGPSPDRPEPLTDTLTAILRVTPPPPATEAGSEAALARAGSMLLGDSFPLPPISFDSNNAVGEEDAVFLRRIAAATGGWLAEGYELTVTQRTTYGLSPPEEAEAEQAQITAALDLVAATGWAGDYVFTPPPPVVLGAGTLMQLRLTRARLPDLPPADWSFQPSDPPEATTMSFAGTSPAMEFDLTDPRLDGASQGMIDLRFSPDWREKGGFDPALVTIADGAGTRFAIHLRDDRAGLVLWDGTTGGDISIPYDFTELRVYHLVVAVMGPVTQVYVNGKLVALAARIGFGTAAPRRLIVGGDAVGESPFTGRIGAVRIWNEVPLPRLIERLRASSGVPGETDPLYPALSHATVYDAATLTTELRTPEPLVTPATGWWALATEADVRIVNLDAFLDGSEPPVFSELQASWLEENRALAVSAQDPGEAADTGLNPHFSVRAAVRLQIEDEGIDLAALALPDGLRGQAQRTWSWQKGDPNWGMVLITDAAGYIVDVRSGRCSTARRVQTRWTCPDPRPQGNHFIAFDTDEVVLSMKWTRYRGGIGNLSFVTSKGTTPTFGSTGSRPDDDPGQGYKVLLPSGVSPIAFTVHYQDVFLKRAVALELEFSGMHQRPGLTLISETGSAARFYRMFADQFRSVDAWPDLLAVLPDVRPAESPVLRVLSDGRFDIDGVPVEFVRLEDRADAAPGTAFNDTFVSLSKAVNLQASYYGYDIVRMDPLYLTRTGTRHPVFRMPEGTSRDYYDANRIFVPKGLFYFPEYTGKNHSTVVTTDTYSEYRDSYSDTVSAGIGGKLAPVSFKASLTMSSARESMAENKNTRTRGLSRAIFYDLVIDKQHMALDPRFVAEAEALLVNYNYDAFLDIFGTHYPVAVAYGGLGVLEMDASETMRQTLTKEGIGLKLEASALIDAETETQASVGYEHNEEHAKTFRQVMGSQVENFYWIGGTHGGAEHSSWSVGTDGVVPVHVSLRPIHELLSPIWFDDPRITIEVRAGLALAIEQRLARESLDLPREVDNNTYTLEVRFDALACTTDGANSWTAPGQTRSGNTVTVTRHERTMFPVYAAAAFSGNGSLLRNLDEHDPPDPATAKAFSVYCPSQEDILPKAPFMTGNTLFRFVVDGPDLLAGRVGLTLTDRRDVESRIVTPSKVPTTALREFDLLGGLFSGGLSLELEKLFTKDGPPLLAPDKDIPRPTSVEHGFDARGRLCAGQRSCPTTKADLDRMDGQWIKQSQIFAPPANCTGCVARRMDYSVRVLK